MMKTRALLTALLAAGVMVASPVVAQDSGAAEQETKDVNKDDLSLGEEVDPSQAIGAPYVRETYGDWEMRCLRTQDGNDPCNLYQLLLDDDGNSVAELSVFDLPQGGPAVVGATVVTPLETLLTEQVVLSVDEAPGRRYPFSYCAAQGCFSRIGFTAEEVDAMRKGNIATIKIVPVVDPTSVVNLTVSLSGFTAGLQAVTESNATLENQ